MDGLYKHTAPADTIRELFPLACIYFKEGQWGVYYKEYEGKRARRFGRNLSGSGCRPKEGSGKHETQEIS
jgi:hypothetical protein